MDLIARLTELLNGAFRRFAGLGSGGDQAKKTETSSNQLVPRWMPSSSTSFSWTRCAQPSQYDHAKYFPKNLSNQISKNKLSLA
jgi:hypothetical protein